MAPQLGSRKMKMSTSFAAVMLGGLLVGAPAWGQDPGGQDPGPLDLTGRLERLESGTAALGRAVGFADAEPGAVQVAQNDPVIPPSLAADFEIRLQRLERALSELTGKYEENAYQTGQLKDRLERINGDIDYRLNALEAGGAKGGGGGAMTAAKPADTKPPAEKPADKAVDKAPDKGGQAVAALPANSTPDRQYEYAFELLRQADYDQAEKAFQQFLSKNKGHALAANAQYWLGETFYVRGKYTEAAVAFAEGAQKYPKGNKAADNILKLGMSLAQLNQKNDACTAFGQLLTKFPEAAASVKRRAEAERRKMNCPG